ncbi:hypothetical protein JA1_002275 [Spathaspora sp. JA1]|nr:hypothetical protein JA1_002275 [Spathaspora sp. JA1]
MLDISQGQEIYETSDVESEDDISQKEVSGPPAPEVYTDSIEPDISRKLFSKNILSTNEEVDFSGSITSNLRTSGYNVTHSDESVEEKLSRIARELEEIRSYDAKDEGQFDKLIETFHELKSNRDTQQQPQFQDLSLDIEEEIVVKNKDVGTANNFKEIIELESRVNTLETIVGQEAILNLESRPEKSIQYTLNDLERKISIINNPEYSFDKVKERITDLIKDSEKLELSKKLMLNLAPGITPDKEQTEETSNKIDELYTALPSLMENSAVIPLLIQRLKTLNIVHSELDSSVKLSGHVDQVLNDITMDMKVWNESIDKLQSNLQEYRENVNNNVNSINDRIEKLTLKVDSLVID